MYLIIKSTLVLVLGVFSFSHFSVAEISNEQLLIEDKKAVDKLFDSKNDYQIVSGSKFKKSKPNSFQKIGIRNSDVIKSYDGKKISSAADSMKMYNEVYKGNVKAVTVLRDGKLVVLKVR